MDEMQVKEQRTLIALKADSFPTGIVPAFNELEQTLGKNRKLYGLSRGDGKNNIEYWACARAKEGEPVAAGFEKIVLQPGTYVGERISNWRGREEIFGQTFQRLVDNPQIDPTGYCVEEYLENGDVICSVRMLPKK